MGCRDLRFHSEGKDHLGLFGKTGCRQLHLSERDKEKKKLNSKTAARRQESTPSVGADPPAEHWLLAPEGCRRRWSRRRLSFLYVGFAPVLENRPSLVQQSLVSVEEGSSDFSGSRIWCFPAKWM